MVRIVVAILVTPAGVVVDTMEAPEAAPVAGAVLIAVVVAEAVEIVVAAIAAAAVQVVAQAAAVVMEDIKLLRPHFHRTGILPVLFLSTPPRRVLFVISFHLLIQLRVPLL